MREELCAVPSELVAALPRPLKIPIVMTLKTLAHARELIERHLLGRVPGAEYMGRVAKCLDDAAPGGEIAGAVVALQMVLSLERVPCLPQVADCN